MEAFVTAGRHSPPHLRPCLGGHMGILAAGSGPISTTNRNSSAGWGTPRARCTSPTPPWPRPPRCLGGSEGRMSYSVELRGKRGSTGTTSTRTSSSPRGT